MYTPVSLHSWPAVHITRYPHRMPSQGRVYMLAGREKHLRGERPMCPLAQAQPGVPPPFYNASCPIISRPFLGRVEKKLRREGLEPPTTAVPGGRQSLYPLTNAVPAVQLDRLTCTADANVYIHQLLRQERPCVQKKKKSCCFTTSLLLWPSRYDRIPSWRREMPRGTQRELIML